MSEEVILVVAGNYGQFNYWANQRFWDSKKYVYITGQPEKIQGQDRQTTRWIQVGTSNDATDKTIQFLLDAHFERRE